MDKGNRYAGCGAREGEVEICVVLVVCLREVWHMEDARAVATT